MRTKLAILVVLITPVLLSGCEFCRKKKTAPPPTAGAGTAVDRDMAESGGDAAGMAASGSRMKSWSEEYADFVEWYEGASAHRGMEHPVEVVEEHEESEDGESEHEESEDGESEHGDSEEGGMGGMD